MKDQNTPTNTLRDKLVELKSNKEWFKNHPEYTKEDWWRFCADDSTMKLEEVLDFVSEAVNKARLDTVDAIIDLFDNPPHEVGAAEDLHYHTHQVVKMLEGCKEHLVELETPNQEEGEKNG